MESAKNAQHPYQLYKGILLTTVLPELLLKPRQCFILESGGEAICYQYPELLGSFSRPFFHGGTD